MDTKDEKDEKEFKVKNVEIVENVDFEPWMNSYVFDKLPFNAETKKRIIINHLKNTDDNNIDDGEAERLVLDNYAFKKDCKCSLCPPEFVRE